MTMLSVLYRNRLPIRLRNPKRFFPSIWDGRQFFSSSDSITSTENAAQTRIDKAHERYKGDPYLRVLSSPMRRCQASMLVLPKLMMFKLVPYKGDHQKPFPLPTLWKAEENALREKEQVQPRTDRWFKRQSKVLLLKRLERESRMLQHKIVTSNSIETKNKFEAELAVKKGFMDHWKYAATTKGKVRQIEGMQKDSNKIRQGSAWWCTINANAASALWTKRIAIKAIYPHKDDFLKEIGKTLESDVIGSLSFLYNQYEQGATEKVVEAYTTELPLLKAGSDVADVGAVIVWSRDSEANRDKVEDVGIPAPTYILDRLFVDKDAHLDEVSKALRNLSHSNAIDQPLHPSETSYTITQNAFTTNLCMSLWRLQIWRDSVAKIGQDVN